MGVINPEDVDSTSTEVKLINETGEFQEGWQKVLPEDIREDATLGNIKGLPDMAKMLVHAQGMVGKDKVVIPNEHATDEDWSEFYGKIGRPNEANDYALAKPEDFPQDLEFSDDTLAGFQTAAHKAGLTSGQVSELFDWYNGISVAGYKAGLLQREEALNTANDTLKKDWGAAYTEKKELAMSVVRSFLDEESSSALDEGLGNDPRMARLFANIGAVISEDKIKGRAPVYTPGETQGEIDRVLGDLKHPYHLAKHPAHADAVAKMSKLYDQIYPEA
jgi:hypothetical protein